jgi:hypothetical protein
MGTEEGEQKMDERREQKSIKEEEKVKEAEWKGWERRI